MVDAKEGDGGGLFLHPAKTRFEVKAQRRGGKKSRADVLLFSRVCRMCRCCSIIHVVQMETIKKKSSDICFLFSFEGFLAAVAVWLNGWQC